jgi:bifunctional non-homologous end joining protein LigD
MALLDLYKKKRDFTKTSEPGPVVRKLEAMKKKKPVFVIQEHHASHLHYDFRLEVNGVLKSWAVPKQPTLDPAIKRLAVEVEDHPLDYADFEGEIPRGSYGAGTVEIWDRGTYLLPKKGPSIQDALEDGKLVFFLEGTRLRGAFSLVRTRTRGGKTHWLLMKKRDQYSQRAA